PGGQYQLAWSTKTRIPCEQGATLRARSSVPPLCAQGSNAAMPAQFRTDAGLPPPRMASRLETGQPRGQCELNTAWYALMALARLLFSSSVGASGSAAIGRAPNFIRHAISRRR